MKIIGAVVLTTLVLSPIGWQPRPQDLDTHALDVGPETLSALLAVDPVLWRRELSEMREYFARYGDRLPAALLEELAGTEQRLG